VSRPIEALLLLWTPEFTNWIVVRTRCRNVIVVGFVVCRLLPGEYSRADVERVFRLLDVDSSGSLDYREFIRGFRVRIKYKDSEPCLSPSKAGFGKLVVDRVCGLRCCTSALVCSRMIILMLLLSCGRYSAHCTIT
jgi:hypothetical protein